MNDDPTPDHLTAIPTQSELLAHGNGEGEGAIRARQELVMLYYGAAYRYLLACLRDPLAAEDLAQHFASRLMEGNYIRQVHLGQGRFRDYLKRSLRNLISDHRKKLQSQRKFQPLSGEIDSLSAPEKDDYESDRVLLASLREELVATAWKALAQVQRESDTPYESVLRLKTEQPHLRSAQIANQLGTKLAKSLSEAGVRQIVRRGREKFANFLLDRVEQLLQSPDPDGVERFLIELELLELCKEELGRRRAEK